MPLLHLSQFDTTSIVLDLFGNLAFFQFAIVMDTRRVVWWYDFCPLLLKTFPPLHLSLRSFLRGRLLFVL
jgi:hypothetical protein